MRRGVEQHGLADGRSRSLPVSPRPVAAVGSPPTLPAEDRLPDPPAELDHRLPATRPLVVEVLFLVCCAVVIILVMVTRMTKSTQMKLEQARAT